MIVFVGNVLSNKGRAISYTEFLVGRLKESTSEDLQLVSGYKNKLLRVIDAVFFLIYNRRKINLIVIDTFSTSAFYYAYVVARLCILMKKRYVLVLHGGNLPQRYKRSPASMKLVFDGAFKIISPSFYLSEFFQSEGFSVQIIPNALEIRHYQYKNRCGIEPNILWVRAFDLIYNPILALRALRLVLLKFPLARLTMVGPVKDSSFQECVEYVKLHGLEDSVLFKGLLTREQWVQDSTEYDIFLNTTTIDNQPLSLLEAMALGFLVISTNVGGIPFLVEHGQNGLLVPSADERAMADAIISLLELDSKSQSALSERARTFAELFDWKNVELKWLTLLNQNQ
ncbi:MAG TPA: glycosyltransferase [Cyclobacteriaceae bacterium]|nr:glycosyltransferase [Cyclobacteriaceae bacterium]